MSATVEVEHGAWSQFCKTLLESFDDAVAPASTFVCICIKLLQDHIWPPIICSVYSPLGPKQKETRGTKYSKRDVSGLWIMHHISEYLLASLLILLYQMHGEQTWILKFLELIES